MELIVKEFKQVPNIEFNYEALKKELSDKLVKYKGQTYDDSAIALAKKDKAALNNLKKAIETRRIEIKKQILEPYEDFETKVKDLVGMIDKPVTEIDKQVKAYEEKVRTEKKANIEEYFNEAVDDLKDILKLDNIFNSKWLNVTVNMKAIKEEIDEQITRIKSDLEVIKNLNSEFYTELNSEYLCNFDLAAVLRKKTQLEEQKKALEERAAKLKKIEEEKQAQKQKMDSGTSIYTKTQETFVKNDSVAPTGENITILDFRVWVTSEQMNLLKQFLKDNNIKFGRVPKEREE